MKRGPGSFYRKLKSLEYLATRDRRAAREFLCNRRLPIPASERLRLLTRYVAITNAVRGYHSLTEMLTVAGEILERERPVVVEAGCGYGASTAKLSLAAKLAGGSLIACDSFRGMPENEERHELMDGRETSFRKGAFRGRLSSVKRMVERWGAPECCRFRKGLLEDTLPALDVTPDVVVLDVDLVASTRTCLRELWPRLSAGGVVISLDGQLRATHALFGNATFWRRELSCGPPPVSGLHRDKLLVIRKTRVLPETPPPACSCRPGRTMGHL